MTTCLLCTNEIDDDDDVRPFGDGFVHVDCGESRLFVYGTLRSGQPLESWLPPGLFRERATLAGFALHFPPDHDTFPLLVETHDPTDVVVGELVTIPVDDDAAVESAIATAEMERRAGYVVACVTVETKAGARFADAFVWPRRPGPRIPGGDWVETPQASIRVDWRGEAETIPETAPETPQGRPSRRSTARPQSRAIETPAPAGDDSRPVAQIAHNTRDAEGHFCVTLTGADGDTIWTGASFADCGRWAKANGYRVEKAPEMEVAS